MRTNPQTGVYPGYYRLVKSYRDENGRECHRTIVNAGYLDELNADQLNLIQKLLTEKVEHCNNPLFTCPDTDDSIVNKYVDKFYSKLIIEKKIDIAGRNNTGKELKSSKDIHRIDVNSIKIRRFVKLVPSG